MHLPVGIVFLIFDRLSRHEALQLATRGLVIRSQRVPPWGTTSTSTQLQFVKLPCIFRIDPTPCYCSLQTASAAPRHASMAQKVARAPCIGLLGSPVAANESAGILVIQSAELAGKTSRAAPNFVSFLREGIEADGPAPESGQPHLDLTSPSPGAPAFLHREAPS